MERNYEKELNDIEELSDIKLIIPMDRVHRGFSRLQKISKIMEMCTITLLRQRCRGRGTIKRKKLGIWSVVTRLLKKQLLSKTFLVY